MFEKQKTVQQSIGLKLKKTKLQQQQKANEIVTSFFFLQKGNLQTLLYLYVVSVEKWFGFSSVKSARKTIFIEP